MAVSDLQEANEHIKALEDAIQWCHEKRAEVSFATDIVYVKVYMNRVMQLRGASTFLDAVAIFMEPE